jgi:hypothetical protein
MAHHCSWCGKSGHKRPTCPMRASAGTPTPSVLIGEIKVGDTVRVLPGVYSPEYDNHSFVVAKIRGDDIYGALPPPMKGEGVYRREKLEILSGVEFGTTEEEPTPTKGKGKTKKKARPVPPCWVIAEAVVPHCRRLLLYGPPGTGKTTAANRVPAGVEVFNVTLTEEMPSAELRGHFVPKGGEFIWNDGPAMQAYRHGGRLVLNEIDRGSSDALVFCYALLDDPGISRITLPTGESVYPHEDFSCVATMNGEPEDLPEALNERLFPGLLIDKPHPDAMKSLPADLQDAAYNSVAGSGDSKVSFRAWKAFADLREKCGEDIAAKAVFGNRANSILDTLKLAKVSLTTSEEESLRAPGDIWVGDWVRWNASGYEHREFQITRIDTDHRGVSRCYGDYFGDGLESHSSPESLIFVREGEI